jgi:hypothetical protein
LVERNSKSANSQSACFVLFKQSNLWIQDEIMTLGTVAHRIVLLWLEIVVSAIPLYTGVIV